MRGHWFAWRAKTILPATPSSLSRTLEGFFLADTAPFKGPRLASCVASGNTEKQVHHQMCHARRAGIRTLFLGVCDGILKGVIKLLRAKINQLLERSSKMGYRARIPASIAMTLQKKWGRWEENWLEQGGPFTKINMNKLHRFYFCRKYGSKRIRDLKGHLTKLTLTLLLPK